MEKSNNYNWNKNNFKKKEKNSYIYKGKKNKTEFPDFIELCKKTQKQLKDIGKTQSHKSKIRMAPSLWIIIRRLLHFGLVTNKEWVLKLMEWPRMTFLILFCQWKVTEFI